VWRSWTIKGADIVIRSVEIKGLRGIREGKLADLSPLVVLVGPNGSGKSTILDALLIAANPSPGEGIGQSVIRREGITSGWPWLLWKMGLDGPAEISITASPGLSRICTLSMTQQQPETINCLMRESSPGGLLRLPPTGAHFRADNNYAVYGQGVPPLEGIPEVLFIGPFPKLRLRPLHELYSDVVRKGLREEVKAIHGDLIPGLDHLEVLTEGGIPVLNLVFANRAVPAILAGDGIALLLRLGMELATRAGGIVLMEEPEVHMHPGAIRQSARAILAAVRRQIQVVLTTHSLEMIDALLSESSDDDLQLMSLYSMQLDAGALKFFRLAGPDVAFSRIQIEDDLR
jgi:energy-coupling factor transporter ATP-binding protein EcfA2